MSGRRKDRGGLKTLLTQIVVKALKATKGVISFETALHELPSVGLAVAHGRISEEEAERAGHLRKMLFDTLRDGNLTADDVWQAVKGAGLERVIRLRDLNKILAGVREYRDQQSVWITPTTFAAAIQDWMDERELREA